MKIRKIEEQDLEAVSMVCMASFSKSIADTLSTEGIATFSKIATSSAFLNRMKGDNLMLIAESDGKINGVIELKEGRHIAMFFVDTNSQKRGVGRQLFSSILNYATADIVTVNASLTSVPAYQKYGFDCKGDISTSAGLVYQPMEIVLEND